MRQNYACKRKKSCRIVLLFGSSELSLLPISIGIRPLQKKNGILNFSIHFPKYHKHRYELCNLNNILEFNYLASTGS